MGKMVKTLFKYDSGFEEFQLMVDNFKKKGIKLDAYKINESGHNDQGDACVYQKFFTSLLQRMLEGVPMTK
jgi:hypothetical protein